MIIETYQRQGRGVYFVVNGGGHKDEEVTVGRAIFCEHDHLSKEVQRDLWQTLNLPEPTFQVDTGGKSIHSYWVFNEPIPIEYWCELQKDLLEYVDGDRSIKNPSRVMRLAGCWHISERAGTGAPPVQKSEGKYNPTRIISESGCTYSYSQLRNLIPFSVNSYQLPVTSRIALRGTKQSQSTVNSDPKVTDVRTNGRKSPLITDNWSLFTEEVPLTINHLTVTEYAADMREGASFPPVLLFFDGADYWLADGFHRLEAAFSIGLKEIAAEVRPGTRRDAILYSVGANTTHLKRF